MCQRVSVRVFFLLFGLCYLGLNGQVSVSFSSTMFL